MRQKKKFIFPSGENAYCTFDSNQLHGAHNPLKQCREWKSQSSWKSNVIKFRSGIRHITASKPFCTRTFTVCLLKVEFWELQEHVFCFKRPTALKPGFKNLHWKQQGMHRAWNTLGTNHTLHWDKTTQFLLLLVPQLMWLKPAQWLSTCLNCGKGMVAQWALLREAAQRRWGNWESESWAEKRSEPPQKGHHLKSHWTVLQYCPGLWQGVRP